MIESGKLRSRIKIFDHNNDEVCEVWADVRPITTREQLRSQVDIMTDVLTREQLRSQVDIMTDVFTVQIRYRSGLNSTMRVQYKDIMYDIVGITDSYVDDSIIITMEMDKSTNRIRSTS